MTIIKLKSDRLSANFLGGADDSVYGHIVYGNIVKKNMVKTGT